MLLLGLDFETTHQEPTLCEIIEVGYALYETETKQIVQSGSWLVMPTQGSVPAEITELTGIHTSMLQYAKTIKETLHMLESLANKASALVAHNATYETQVIKKYNANHALLDLMVIDTYKDLPYPSTIRHFDLERLSLAYKCPNLSAHRALPDVMTMFNILSTFDFEAVVAWKTQPTITLKALVSFHDKDKAKNLGFYFDSTKKEWLKQVKESMLDDLLDKIQSSGFTTIQVETH